MKLKKNLQMDALANLYRAAFYLAKGEIKLGKDFLRKADRRLKEKNLFKELMPFSNQPRLLAEKVLDQYHLLKVMLK